MTKELGPAGPRDLNDAILEPAQETLRGRSRQAALAEVMMALMPLILMLNTVYTVCDDPKQGKCLGNQHFQFHHYSGTCSEKRV